MSRLKWVYVGSLIVLAGLIVSVFLLIPRGERFSEVQRDQLIEREDVWIMQFDIFNNEGENTSYTINVLVNDRPYTQQVSIGSGRKFTYIEKIYKDTFEGGEVSFAVYKEGESAPIEETTYFVRFD